MNPRPGARHTILNNPLDAVLPAAPGGALIYAPRVDAKTPESALVSAPRPDAKTPAGAEIEAPSGAGPAARGAEIKAPSGAAKQRLTVHLPVALIERVKNAVYWTAGLTLARLAEEALEEAVARHERERGGPFPRRRAELAGGRPLT